MGFFGRKKRSSKDDWVADGPPMDPRWAKSGKGRFHRFMRLDPEAQGLSGVGGVFVVWHAGAKPKWVRVGRSGDLAATFHQLTEDDGVMAYESSGGLYVTWSLIRPEFRDGVVRFLSDRFDPLLGDGGVGKAAPVPVLAPGDKAASD